jgi:hypothetical protein
MKKTKRLPSRFRLVLEKETRATLTPLSINSRDIKTRSRFRRITTPKKPIEKSRKDKTKKCCGVTDSIS